MNKFDGLTYISLFSSAGVGCYGFQLEGFDCVATNEIVPRRLEVQKFNNKCKYSSGYICGDITNERVKQELYDQVDMWKLKEGLLTVDLLVATPPCQGMSVANHKKKSNEICRNSLVVESIKIINKIKPKFFIFENVPSFMKTVCTDIDGKECTISSAIENNLGGLYSYYSDVINFKDYGSCSSRRRSLVIGVLRDLADEISPIDLFPTLKREKTLREVIGSLRSFEKMGEIDSDDIYHFFRRYPERMRDWITGLDEGESAFDNYDDMKKPHRVINGEIVLNKRKNSGKYTRQYWDKVAPCIHTRNDQLASQNTIHPVDDRVFSIRELMLMMTVPSSFKWVEEDFDSLNQMSISKKNKFLKKEEIKIRQSLGEAVPTTIFQEIASNIKREISYACLKPSDIKKIISINKLNSFSNLENYINNNPNNLSYSSLSKIAEAANTNRHNNAAFYTSKALITELIKTLPSPAKNVVNIIEPSVGVGNFIPFIIKKFEGKIVNLDVVDIDDKSLEITKALLKKIEIPSTFKINYINADFLLYHFDKKYDYVIGNPPFIKMSSTSDLLKIYRKSSINKTSSNLCSFFLDKSIKIGCHICLILPKSILNTPEFSSSREYLKSKAVEDIIDFGELGFPGVLIETVAIHINNSSSPLNTNVVSLSNGFSICQSQNYIFDAKLPYWVIYRDAFFDEICSILDFGVFKVFRDRQITNNVLTESGDIRVLKSRNINNDGSEIVEIDGYDRYISRESAKNLAVFKYLDDDSVYLTPNMTYKPRLIKKPKHCLVNGSVAILIPNRKMKLSKRQTEFFSSEKYRVFLRKARNYQTRSLNIDSCSVYFYGVLKDAYEDCVSDGDSQQ